MSQTWHEEQFGVCPHGMPARVYCGVCVSEDDAAAKAAKADRMAARQNQTLKETVKRQSVALDDAELRNSRLQRRLREAWSARRG